MPDLAGGTDQVGVIQLRRDIVFVGLGEEPAETQGLVEKCQRHIERRLPGKLKLTVNEEKTRICRVPDGEFDFLGYTFGRMYSPTTGKARLGYRPSKKSIKRMVERVHALTDRADTWQETTVLVDMLNRALCRWPEIWLRDRREQRNTASPAGS